MTTDGVPSKLASGTSGIFEKRSTYGDEENEIWVMMVMEIMPLQN